MQLKTVYSKDYKKDVNCMFLK